MQSSTVLMFEAQTFRNALSFYGLPKDYKYIFQPASGIGGGLKPINPFSGYNPTQPIWVQMNQPTQGHPLTKANNANICCLKNITLDFEYPADPGRVLKLAQRLVNYLISQKLAAPGLPLENSGAGAHIVLPIVSISLTELDENEKKAQWLNEAVAKTVQEFILPEFERLKSLDSILSQLPPKDFKLEAFDISRIMSTPGTWRPGGRKSNEAEFLKSGFMRHWLSPFNEIGNIPVRQENQNLTDLVLAQYQILAKAKNSISTPIKNGEVDFTVSRFSNSNSSLSNNNKIDPATYINEKAGRMSLSGDRSNDFYRLVCATFKKFDRQTVLDYATNIDQATGNKYQGRERREAERALQKAERMPDDANYKPYKQSNVNAKNTSTATAKDENLVEYEPNDDGNALAFLSVYGEEFIYTDAIGWLSWNGKFWDTDCSEAKLRLKTVEVLKRRRAAAALSEKEAIVKYCVPNINKVDACIRSLKPYLTISEKIFDQDPDLLNCDNGVLNLRTGEITAHSPSQRFTYCTSVGYFPDADQSIWRNFLFEAVGEIQEIVYYIQLLLGYGITGYTLEECLAYIYGPGRSGKGTLTEAILKIMGKPLATETNFSSLTEKRNGDSQNFDLAPLRAARLLFASESGSQTKMDEAKIKLLTGGNDIHCAFKHKNFFNYKPQFLTILSSNHPIKADPDDNAFWARIKVIHFPNSHIGQEDRGLKPKMHSAKALRGLLAFMVDGAKIWYKTGSGGIEVPDVIKNLTATHRAENDTVAQWLEQCTEIDGSYWEANEYIYKSYEQFCTDNGYYPKKMVALGKSLSVKGYIVSVLNRNSTNGGKVQRGVQGLRIL